jgi:formylglycine-generating enzyme required for sulfatase activity
VLRLALAAAVLAVSWVSWSRLRKPSPQTTARSSADMARIDRAELLLGVEEGEARQLFTDCRASYGEACGERFESSLFAREVRPPGTLPVSVESFHLDKTEVSRREFVRWLNRESGGLRVEGPPPKQRIVDASGHPLAAVRTGPLEEAKSETGAAAETAIRYGDRSFFLDDERRADNPVTLVSWHGARRFCEGQGKRLPTEHEWELAARGSARRRFPWGEAPPERCEDVVFARAPGGFCERAARGPAPVGASAGDVTRDGVRDLGGNVTEWTSSPFKDGGASSPCGNAAGPCRVLRGGSYTDGPLFLRGSIRIRRAENEFWLNIGFRCARGGPVES